MSRTRERSLLIMSAVDALGVGRMSEESSSPQGPQIHASLPRQCLRYSLHVIVIYLIVNTTTMWLAGFFHGRLLPFVQHHAPAASSFQFAFSHLFAFSFWPATAVAFVYAQWFRHRVALFVWVIPVALLAYKFATFPVTIFQSHFDAAFHQYFGGGFIIPEWHSYKELFDLVGSNPDMPRGMEQLRYSAPAYAGVGYAIGTWLALRFHIDALEKLKPTVRSFTPVRPPAAE